MQGCLLARGAFREHDGETGDPAKWPTQRGTSSILCGNEMARVIHGGAARRMPCLCSFLHLCRSNSQAASCDHDGVRPSLSIAEYSTLVFFVSSTATVMVVCYWCVCHPQTGWVGASRGYQTSDPHARDETPPPQLWKDEECARASPRIIHRPYCTVPL